MWDTATIFWNLIEWLPPVVAGLGAGLWLLRRGQRLAGGLFLAWALATLVLSGCHRWALLFWQHRPGVTGDDWLFVVRNFRFLTRMGDALALTAFVVAAFRQRADES